MYKWQIIDILYRVLLKATVGKGLWLELMEFSVFFCFIFLSSIYYSPALFCQTLTKYAGVFCMVWHVQSRVHSLLLRPHTWPFLLLVSETAISHGEKRVSQEWGNLTDLTVKAHSLFVFLSPSVCLSLSHTYTHSHHHSNRIMPMDRERSPEDILAHWILWDASQ